MKKNELFIGFDLGGTKMIATLFDSSFNILGFERNKTEAHEEPEKNINSIISLIKETFIKHNKQGTLCGIGIAVPGIIAKNKRTIINTTNLVMQNINLTDLIEKEFGCPCILENDVKAGIKAELYQGALKGFKDAAGFFIGTGIGGSLVLNGSIHNGLSGIAGELGHMIINTNGPLCGCGNYGCLEALASRSAMSKDAIFVASSGKAPKTFASAGNDFKKYKSKIFEDALINNETEIIKIIDKSAFYLGIACANITHILNPEAILLGGGLINRIGDYYIKKVKVSYDEHTMKGLNTNVQFLLSSLKDQAVPTGAALSVMMYIQDKKQ